MGGGPAWVKGRRGWWAGVGGVPVWVVGQHGWWASMGGGPAWVVGQHGWWASMDSVRSQHVHLVGVRPTWALYVLYTLLLLLLPLPLKLFTCQEHMQPHHQQTTLTTTTKHKIFMKN